MGSNDQKEGEMTMMPKIRMEAIIPVLFLWLSCSAAQSQSPESDDLGALRARLDAQAQLLEEQARELDRQRLELNEQRRQLQLLLQQQAEGGDTGKPAPSSTTPSAGRAAPSQQTAETAGDAPDDAATRPPEEKRTEQEITVIADVGGVLTPQGTLTLEPTISASHTSSNRFFFQGVEIVDAILIGAIEATESRRNYLAAQLGLRYGLTDRLELSSKIPFVYRDDRVESTVLSEAQGQQAQPTFLQNIDGSGLGDIEFGLQYQLNDGQDGWPYFIANMRAKSTTGEGPFSVARDSTGLETELATGSGFWSVEPSVTMIFRSDPAVFFTNFGYIYNISRDVDLTTGGSTIGRVNPGDTISGSFGMGFALNEKLSVSLGYQHNYVFGTKSMINDNLVNSQDFQVGSFLFGMSLGVGKTTGLSMNVGVGVTEESPDVEFTLRMPFSFLLFE
jgi:hypothetical protein